ncbi:MAG: dUTP diphosphatase [Patescibacteria group bacterium]|jgi:dUTP pyrophosphatase
MKVKIKRIEKDLPLPDYQTPGSVAFDLYSRTAMTIPAKTVSVIPTNLIIETPPGYMLAIVPRSSTPKRKGLLIPHGLGIVDQDYCGEKDEILLQVYNFTDNKVTIDRGERIGQAVFIRIDKTEWEETDQMQSNSRGGYGSTGK